jgi:Flp pilus assembly protein TadD
VENPGDMRLNQIRNLASEHKFREALSQLEELLDEAQECPYLWTFRGALILLLESEDGPTPSEAVRSYVRALELDPGNLEALEGLAHYYDVIDRRPEDAKKYANAYLEKAKPILDAMERIVADEE